MQLIRFYTIGLGYLCYLFYPRSQLAFLVVPKVLIWVLYVLESGFLYAFKSLSYAISGIE